MCVMRARFCSNCQLKITNTARKYGQGGRVNATEDASLMLCSDK